MKGCLKEPGRNMLGIGGRVDTRKNIQTTRRSIQSGKESYSWKEKQRRVQTQIHVQDVQDEDVQSCFSHDSESHTLHAEAADDGRIKRERLPVRPRDTPAWSLKRSSTNSDATWWCHSPWCQLTGEQVRTRLTAAATTAGLKVNGVNEIGFSNG